MGQVLEVIAFIACTVAAVAVVAGVCYGVYKIGKWIYSWIKCKIIRYQPNSSIIEIASASNQQITNIQSNIQPVNIPWKKINITNDDIQCLKILTKKQFWQQVELWECDIAKGNQVMRKPVGMKCCGGKQLADKCNVLKALKNNPNKCPMCGSRINQNSMIEEGKVILMAEKGIQTLRKRIQITFNKMSLQLRAQFQQIVKQCFGQDHII